MPPLPPNPKPAQAYTAPMTTVDLPPQLDASVAKAQLAALCRALDALPRGSVCRLNAAGVQRFDSAGLALLLACRRHA